MDRSHFAGAFAHYERCLVVWCRSDSLHFRAARSAPRRAFGGGSTPSRCLWERVEIRRCLAPTGIGTSAAPSRVRIHHRGRAAALKLRRKGSSGHAVDFRGHGATKAAARENRGFRRSFSPWNAFEDAPVSETSVTVSLRAAPRRRRPMLVAVCCGANPPLSRLPRPIGWRRAGRSADRF